MAKHLWGYQSHLLTGTVQAGSEVQGLPASNLQNDQGDTASAWQTAQGVVTSAAGAWLVVDAGADVTWRAALLARTNLTSAAQIRVRVGSRSSVVEEVPSFDLADPASLDVGKVVCTRSGTATRVNSTGLIEAVPANTPRWDYDPVTRALRGLLNEPARTNLLKKSQDFTGLNSAGGWLKYNTAYGHSADWASYTPASTEVAAPDGSFTSCKVTPLDTNKLLLRQFFPSGYTVQPSTTYTISAYIYYPSGSAFALNFNNDGWTWSTGSISPSPFWQRIPVTFTTSAAPAGSLDMFDIEGGPSIGVPFWIWGVQMEVGAYMTSYIPTTTLPVTRAADLLTAALQEWFSSTAGTIVVEAELYAKATNFPALAAFSDGTTSNRIAILLNGGISQFNPYMTVAAGGASQADFPPPGTGNPTVGVPFRAAMTWRQDDFAFCLSGGAVYTDTIGSVPTGLTVLHIGSSAGQYAPVRIRRLSYFPRRLANAQIQGLTGAAGSTLTAPTYDSGTVTPGVVPGVGQALHVLPSDATGQCLRIDVDDPTNPDRMINVPLAYTGPVWQPQYNFGYGSTQGREARRADVVTRGGQTYPRLDSVARRQSLELRAITTDEVWTRLAPLMRAAETGANILCVPDPEGAYRQHETIFGPLKTEADISYPYQGSSLRGWTATQTERL
ncbi:phage head spike fiber domain-containing protein [Azospirillum himalayense]|uniref:Minor tail protein n=1 Tax=Azospirillum himalayense TaxID=654847 RepID=A0ABW0GCD9_9PROT